MTQGTALFCTDSANGTLKVQEFARLSPKAGEVEVAVEAASVNPIDVQRVTGYGRKLLSLIGAGKFPLILGNDFAGTISAVGPNTDGFSIGDRVYGVKKASRAGTHASHVVVKASPATLAKAPEGHELQTLAALPYSFTTMWLAVQGAGLTRQNASGKKVLVHGAAGGLGTFALRMLSDWGAEITAIAYPKHSDRCLAAGATEVIDLATTPFESIGRKFDATLNFAVWDHDMGLLSCLKEDALGHATTVHPMLRNFDESGLLGGAFKTFTGKKRSRKALPGNAANYAWTIFAPSEGALEDLGQMITQGRADLDIGLRAPLAEGVRAFEFMREANSGRALILP